MINLKHVLIEKRAKWITRHDMVTCNMTMRLYTRQNIRPRTAAPFAAVEFPICLEDG